MLVLVVLLVGWGVCVVFVVLIVLGISVFFYVLCVLLMLFWCVAFCLCVEIWVTCFVYYLNLVWFGNGCYCRVVVLLLRFWVIVDVCLLLFLLIVFAVGFTVLLVLLRV